MKFNNEKRVQNQVSDAYMVAHSNSTNSNFPLLIASAANFINEKSSDFHSASGRGKHTHNSLRVVGTRKKFIYFKYWMQKNVCEKIYSYFFTENVMNTLEIMYIYVNIFKEETYKRVRLVWRPWFVVNQGQCYKCKRSYYIQNIFIVMI